MTTTPVSITIDLEQDCPPFLQTFWGVTEGVPRLLRLFAELQIPATFFSTGEVARRYPEVVGAIADGGHELGCHGDTHQRFSSMSRAEAIDELTRATSVLRPFGKVTSFRAPNLDLPERYLPLLCDAGFTLDSSQGRHKQGSYFVKPSMQFGLRRIPASISPSPLRTPGPIRDAILRLLSPPVVLFFHPWEFVDMTKTKIPWDCRVRTGEPALFHLRQAIEYLRRRGARFHRMADLQVPKDPISL